jgi:hypothetical protein
MDAEVGRRESLNGRRASPSVCVCKINLRLRIVEIQSGPRVSGRADRSYVFLMALDADAQHLVGVALPPIVS